MSVHKIHHIFRLCVLIAYVLASLAAQKFSTCTEIHGESSKAYRMKLSPLEQKVLMNIQLGVICTDMVDSCWPPAGHIIYRLNS